MAEIKEGIGKTGDAIATAESYGAGARFFHWTTLALVLLLVPIGLTMTSLDPGRLQDVLFVIHESLGLTLFVLIIARLLWRLTHVPPPPSRDLTALEIFGSRAVHWLLYIVILAMPISGYLLVAAGDYPLTYFGMAHVPRLVATNKALAERAEDIHMALQYAVYLLVALHAGAALHHHFFRHNDVLARMLPRLLSRR